MEWTETDRDQLRDYLLRSKHRLLNHLKSLVPKADGKDFQEVALQAKEAKGASDIIDQIDQAAQPQITRQESAPFADPTKGMRL